MPSHGASCRAESWRGLPCWRITLPQGDSLLVAEHGAQVLSWVSKGRERLYLSPGSVADGHTAIRGGVPICWPQFNQQGPLPKHGFARNLPWQKGGFGHGEDHAEMRLHLAANVHTLSLWPHRFDLTLVLRLHTGRLRLTLEVRNPTDTDWAFTGALHTYLRVDDLAHARLWGLAGQAEWDSLRNTVGQGASVIALEGPFDRVYEAAPQALRLVDGAMGLAVSQSDSWASTVVWNPGGSLPDLPEAQYRHMWCVEAAQVQGAVMVPAGGCWVGWQQLDVLAG